MGEIADMMINGEICEMCGLPLEEDAGYPTRCADCGGDARTVISNEFVRDQSKAAKSDRLRIAAEQVAEAKALAAQHDIELGGPGGVHYQLRSPKRGWLINIYPSNQRLFMDRKKPRAPFLHMPDDRHWNLIDAVRAAIEASK